MKTLNEYKKIYLGTTDNGRIYLSPPSWDCGWYWGFGYLGNKNCHYHVEGVKTIETYKDGNWSSKKVGMVEGFKEHFGESFIVKDDNDIWTLTELFETFYSLKETAKVLGHGGSCQTTNPIADLIKNPDEVKRLNEIVFPQLFEEIYKILAKYN